MPRLTPNAAPPPDYYANNLVTVASHVVENSSDLLGDELTHVRALLALSTQGKRLLARLIMRTTTVIRIDSLRYDEIADLSCALEELAGNQLIELNGPVAADSLLDRLKVAEIKALFPDLVRAKDRKQDLVQRILANHTDTGVLQRCKDAHGWLLLTVHAALKRVRLAYFGDLYRDLTEFVMRDLGVSTFEDYPLGDNARAFTSAAEADQYVELSSLQSLPIHRRDAALDWLFEYPAISTETLTNRSLQRRRDKLLIGWGRDFERAASHPQAHACYQRSRAHPARERRVRMLKKDGEETASGELLAAIRARPYSAEEALFATRFGVRGGTKKSPQSWQETTWLTPHAQLPNVEERTAARLMANGGQAWHSENRLLPTLLGLAFWDILFAPVPGMFTHPFQAAPRDLYWPDFRARRESAIAERLAECGDHHALWSRISATLSQKYGRACRLVSWGLATHNEGAILVAAHDHFQASSLQAVFDYMLNDLGAVRSGMPDLFVAYGGGHYELVEVKGPSDQLQPNQRIWLAKLCEMGIPSRVIKHKFVGA